MSRITSDFLRVVSILAVLAIHATGTCEWRFHQEHAYASAAFLGVILNQLCRFSVPLFVLLSGFSLASREKTRGPLEPLRFYRDRLYRIGLPYLVWTVVILLERHQLRLVSLSAGQPFLPALGVDLQNLGHYLFQEGADYHFYFFAIILECYLVFPLLQRLRRPWILGAFLTLHLAACYPLYLVQSGFSSLGLPLPSSFVLLFVFYFYAGMRLAEEPERLRGLILRLGTPGWLALAAAWAGAVLSEYVFLSYRTPSPAFYDHFQRITVMGYALCVWALVVCQNARITRAFSTAPARRNLALLAAWSFSVFIFHTRILRGLEKTPLRAHFFLLLPCLWIASFSLVGLFERWIRGPRVLRRVLGLP